MNLREFQHKINAIYGAYVSARQTNEDHDALITVALVDSAPGIGEGVTVFTDLADVWLDVEDGIAILCLGTTDAAEIRAASIEEPPEKEETNG